MDTRFGDEELAFQAAARRFFAYTLFGDADCQQQRFAALVNTPAAESKAAAAA